MNRSAFASFISKFNVGAIHESPAVKGTWLVIGECNIAHDVPALARREPGRMIRQAKHAGLCPQRYGQLA